MGVAVLVFTGLRRWLGLLVGGDVRATGRMPYQPRRYSIAPLSSYLEGARAVALDEVGGHVLGELVVLPQFRFGCICFCVG